MRNYKQWSGEQRKASLVKTKEAILAGTIPHQSKLPCNRCGQDKGIRDYHNEDYSHPTKYLEPLCYVCHMVHHSDHKDAAGCEAYWAWVKAGNRTKPLYSRSYGVLYALGILRAAHKQHMPVKIISGLNPEFDFNE